jgi:hypothetical protein
MLDGAETDVDCGGPACAKCPTFAHCSVDTDCESNICTPHPGAHGGHCEEPPPPVLAYWPFDGTGADASGNGHDATFGGTASYTAEAFFGSNAGVFTGTTGWADVGGFDVGNQFTISGWVYLPSPNSPNSFMVLSTGPELFSGGFSFYVNTPEQANQAIGFESSDGSSFCNLYSENDVVSLDTWEHVAITVNRSLGTATLYVNGAVVSGSGCVTPTLPTNQPFTIGANPAHDFPITAHLDELRVFGAILSASQVAALANP